MADHYHGLLDKIAARGMDAEISVKPTQLGLDLDRDAPLAPTLRRWRTTRRSATACSGSTWRAAPTPMPRSSCIGRLKETHPNIGICLQAYLRRTPADVNALLPLKPAIRLVKGAYDEHAEIAFRRKDEVDAAYQSLCVLMLSVRRPAASCDWGWAPTTRT